MRTTRDRAFSEVSGLRSSGLVYARRRGEGLGKLGEGREKARRTTGSHRCLIIKVNSRQSSSYVCARAEGSCSPALEA